MMLVTDKGEGTGLSNRCFLVGDPFIKPLGEVFSTLLAIGFLESTILWAAYC